MIIAADALAPVLPARGHVVAGHGAAVVPQEQQVAGHDRRRHVRHALLHAVDFLGPFARVAGPGRDKKLAVATLTPDDMNTNPPATIGELTQRSRNRLCQALATTTRRSRHRWPSGRRPCSPSSSSFCVGGRIEQAGRGERGLCRRRARQLPADIAARGIEGHDRAVAFAVVGDAYDVVDDDRRLAEAVLLLERTDVAPPHFVAVVRQAQRD